MVSFYTGSGSGSGTGGQSSPKLAATYTETNGGGSAEGSQPKVGRVELDLSDPLGSVADGIGSLGGFVGGIGKGVLDFAGSAVAIQPKEGEGGFELGQAVENIGGAVGFGLGEIGKTELPYLGDDPNRRNATLADVVPFVADQLSTPGRAVEAEAAKLRARRAEQLIGRGLSLQDVIAGSGLAEEEVLALHEGTATIDQVAENMVARGAGFASHSGVNLANQIILDPLNLILPGVSKAGQAAKGAGLSMRAAETAATLGLPQRFVGTAYNAVTKGMSAPGQALMGRVIGPTTAGVFHALGTKPVFAIRNGLGKISGAYADAFDDALARGSAQYAPAVVAKQIAEEAEVGLARIGDDVTEEIGERVIARRQMSEKALEREVEHMVDRTVPLFHRSTPMEMLTETARKLALITGGSVEDMVRSLGSKVSREQARATHLAFYGKAGSDLAKAKAASIGAKNIDTERLTLLAPDTLTVEKADELLKIGKTSGAAVEDAVQQYEMLARKFAGKTVDDAKVLEYVKNLKAKGLLAEAVKLPKAGKNALPGPLGQWRQTYRAFDYEIGFAPKDGWKAVIDETGEVVAGSPFVHFVDEALPLAHRNPLGRFMDSLTRGVTQTKIVSAAKQRMMLRAVQYGLTDAEVDRVFGAVLHEARETRSTPRGLGIRGGEFDRIFKGALGDERYAAFRKAGGHPTFEVMRAFEGNFRQVGLTQKFTGMVKSGTAPYGNFTAAIAEGIYPLYRFKLRPNFQMQELVESPFFNVIRGARPAKPASLDAAKVMHQLAEAGDEFRWTFEAGYVTHLAGAELATSIARGGPIGRALAKAIPEGGVVGFKERRRLAQVFSEHGDSFKAALDRANPRLSAAMREAYGPDTKGWGSSWIDERLTLAKDPNAIKKFLPAPASADEATIMAAFEESWRQSMTQAFRTHYFNPQRSWLERTINHPYLGLYPASYMWGKVLPEFARFLLRKPFGMDYPLGGAVAFAKVQEWITGEIADQTDLANFIRDNPDAWYFMSMMIPGTPTSLPVGAPAWARHLVEDTKGGAVPLKDPAAFAEREAFDAIKYASPARDVGDLGQAAGDIFASLEKAAKEFDGMFSNGTPQPTAPSIPTFEGLRP